MVIRTATPLRADDQPLGVLVDTVILFEDIQPINIRLLAAANQPILPNC